MRGWFILQKGIGGRGFPQVPFLDCRQQRAVHKVCKVCKVCKVKRFLLVVSCEY